MPVDALIGVPCIRNDLKWAVQVGHVARALESPWEQGRYHTIRGPDGRMWIAPKKTVMLLEDRVKYIDGLRGVHGAIEVTAESAAADPEFRKM